MFESFPKQSKTEQRDDEVISRRNFLTRGAAASMVTLVNLHGTESLADTTRLSEDAIEKITMKDVDFTYRLISNEKPSTANESVETDASTEAVLLIDWQARFIGDTSNPDITVQKQIQETQANIIDQLHEAMAQNAPIILVGISNSNDTPEEALKSGGTLAEIDFLSPAYPEEIIRELESYEQVHYIIKEHNSALDDQGESREDIMALLKDIETVRVMGINESVCAWRTADDVLDQEFDGGKNLIINPSQLADSQQILDSDLDARELYDSLPKGILFNTALKRWIQSDGTYNPKLFSDLAVEITAQAGGKTEQAKVTFDDIISDFEKYLSEYILPDYVR